MIDHISKQPDLVQFVRLWSANFPRTNVREAVLIGFRPGYAMSTALKLKGVILDFVQID